MAEINQFGSAKPVRSGKGMTCAECEAMLTDAIDGTLSPKDHAAFDLHIATCKECSQMMAEAKRGAALLEMLKSPRPEPSSALLDRIIAQTSGTAAAAAPTPAASVLGLSVIDDAAKNASILVSAAPLGVVPVPGATLGNVLPFRPRAAKFSLQAITRTMMQPRFAMTAAMAFFSIALTMNLTGVHLSELKASDLKPSNIRHTFYQADASLVRYYDNLRVVYELESRVNDIKQSNDNDSSSAAGKTDSKGDAKDGSSKDGNQKRSQPKAGSGTSQRRSPLQQEFKLADELPDRHADHDDSLAMLYHRGLPDSTDKSKETLQEGGLA